MLEHFLSSLPVLIVALPMLVAPIIAILQGNSDRGRWLSWVLCFATTGLSFAICFHLLINVLINGPQIYFISGWPPPIGIEYEAGIFTSIMLLLVSGLAFLTMPYALCSIEKSIPHRKVPLFYASFLLCLSGFLGMIISNDLFNIFVFLEISSITCYAIIALGKSPHALTAAFNYLIIGTVGGTFYLMSVALIYMMTGTLNFSDVAHSISSGEISKPLVAALCMMITGLGIKAAIFPLSAWLVPAYTNSPTYFSAFLSGTSTKVSIFILFKILYILFPASLIYDDLNLDTILMAAALMAIIYGSLAAISQQNVKRMLAYSSIANIGYMFMAIALFNEKAVIALLLLMVSHAIAKVGAFLVVGAIEMSTDSVDIKSFNGMGKKMPGMMAAFIIFGLSLIGTPLTAGFIAKWYLLDAAMQEGGFFAIGLLAAIIFSSLLTIIYIWKIVEAAYFRTAHGNIETPNYYVRISIWALAVSIILLGIISLPLISFGERIIGGLVI
ncbi:MAG: cation:proton antiporter [Alphaproteobacteria bacterium CG11_big_fil_rev_8_21_14_0_20_44_7]|nr:MAG: cation:proton antiporter [Alphaproteobacteria bacterium CG11_big_fil_rev_8_21_14_0_20_44_7]